MTTIDRIVLTWPRNLTDSNEVKPAGKNRSWIQLVRTGHFVSNRYGKFSITKHDLSTMLTNFATITPKSPTELPIDYDHLSMDPKKPGDGIAAGWMKRLELRENGEELWAEVEWTRDGATRIANQEYRFVSPSFVKDYTHKDGKKIGTTLLAAAITNHPFLQGMKALTLYNFSVMGDLAGNLDDAAMLVPGAIAPKTLSLMEVGQRVSVKQADELTPEERAMTFVIAEVRGEGDDGFVFLKTLDGVPFGWFSGVQLAPASATPDPTTNTQEATTMSTTDPGGELLTLATTIAKDRRMDFRAALLVASREHPALAQAHREAIANADVPDALEVETPNQRPSSGAGDTLMTLANQIAKDRHVSLRDALIEASRQQPEAAVRYQESFNAGLRADR